MEPFMTIRVLVDTRKVSQVQGKYSQVKMIPLMGKVESVFFNGIILPGSSDVQTVDAAGVYRSQARIMIEGKDGMERTSLLYMENTGVATDNKSSYMGCPVFSSDSEYLMEILGKPVFRSEVQMTTKGMEINVYSLEEVEMKEVVVKKEKEEELEASEEALEIMNSVFNHSLIKKLVFVQDMGKNAKVVENPDIFQAAGYLTKLSGSYQLLFMVNELEQLIALGYISGKVRDIEQEAITILLSVMREYGKEEWFEKPVSQYERYRIGK